MCDHHTGKVLEALRAMPVQYGHLRGMTSGAGIDDGSKHTKGDAAPVPINVQARSLQDDMLALTLEAHDAVARRAKLSLPPKRHPHHPHGVEWVTITRRCRVLAAHHVVMIEADARYGVEALRIHHAIRSLLGETRLAHRLDPPCPYCDTIALVREDGSSWVRCENCGAAFDDKHYGLLVRMVADQLPPQPARVRKSVHAKVDDRTYGRGW
jgi:ribosomal protein L37AE/L43A